MTKVKLRNGMVLEHVNNDKYISLETRKFDNGIINEGDIIILSGYKRPIDKHKGGMHGVGFDVMELI